MTIKDVTNFYIAMSEDRDDIAKALIEELNRKLGFDRHRVLVHPDDIPKADIIVFQLGADLDYITDVALSPQTEVWIAERDGGTGWKFNQPETEQPERGIENKAHDLVYGDRNKTYGKPTEDFTRTGKIWGAILGIPPIPPEIVSIMMVGLKISRLCKTPDHYDTRVDGIGYFLTLDRVINDV